VNFPAYLQNFWDFDNSPYAKENSVKTIVSTENTSGQKLSAEKYWTPFFNDRFRGDIIRRDIENFIDDMAGKNFSTNRKNGIIMDDARLGGWKG
jgi:hypothetical protein